jgi:hypothetical protein
LDCVQQERDDADARADTGHVSSTADESARHRNRSYLL